MGKLEITTVYDEKRKEYSVRFNATVDGSSYSGARFSIEAGSEYEALELAVRQLVDDHDKMLYT